MTGAPRRRRQRPHVLFASDRVVIATGGLGALYPLRHQSAGSFGEGLGMAARAGALIADPEFVQFHPTAIDIGAIRPLS